MNKMLRIFSLKINNNQFYKMNNQKEEKLPIGWVTTTLGEITNLSRNRANPQDFSNLPYIGLEHVEAYTMKLKKTINSSEVKSSSFYFFPGDVLYA